MKTILFAALLLSTFSAYSAPLSFPPAITRWSKDINYASKVTGVPAVVIASVMEVESSGDPDAVSNAGAVGLMQVMPRTAVLIGIKKYWIPRQNILAGAIYLAALLQHYKGNLQLAIAAYNEGPGALDKSGGVVEYGETKEYVKKVFRVLGGG